MYHIFLWQQGSAYTCDKKKKKYEAYLTIEASFIVPISFLLIIVTIYFGFFCYEKSVSLQSCYLAALRGSNEWNLSEIQLEQYIDKELTELQKEKNMYDANGNCQVKVGIHEIEVSIEKSMEVPFSKVRGDNVDGWGIYSKKSAIRNKPASYIRKIQLLKTGGDNK